MSLGRCGYVAIIGRPNVGKSTLTNALLGSKVSITSAKPQTTRFQIMGIKTRGQIQAVYIDTPGIHPDEKRAMNRYMNRLASAVIPDADVIVWVIEALQWTADDDLVLRRLKKLSQAAQGQLPPLVLAVNKMDTLKDKGKLLPFLEKVKDNFSFADIVPISAAKSNNLNELEKCIEAYLPEGPHLFSAEELTDKGPRFQVAEIIREKLLDNTEQEVPYATTVEIEDWKTLEGGRLEISVVIWVEREGQRRIVIGKKGMLLKKVGVAARKEIETLLKQKIFLRLWVKVKEHWTDNDKALRQLGYK